MDSSADRPARILELLKELYPAAASELNFRNEFELIVAVILSAQCTDRKVNEVTPELFSKFGSFAKLAEASQSAVEKIIGPVNYYRTKAKHLIAMAKQVVGEFGSEVPRERSALMSLPGVGRKTANVILSELGVEHALAVDTHVFRVSRRLGLADGDTPAEIENQLAALYPPAEWRSVHHSLILHGRRVCKALRPLCAECGVAELCPSRGLWDEAAAAAETDSSGRRKTRNAK